MGGPRLLRTSLVIAFSLLAIQGAASLAARLWSGGDDRLHPLLHLASGLAGLALLARPAAQGAYAAGFGVFYLALGVFGALLGLSPAWLPLGPVDHAFHATVGTLVGAGGWTLLRRAGGSA